jgi:hypothetical protein
MARLPTCDCGRLGGRPVRRSCSRRRSCQAAGLLFLHLGKEASFDGCFFAGSVRVPEGALESSFVSPTSVKGRGYVTTSLMVVSVMAGGWPDLCSTLALRKMAADRCSSSKLCLGVVWATIRAASTIRCVSCEDWS